MIDSAADTGFDTAAPRRDARPATRGAPRGTRVTINDLAADLGLTKGTVSRALNGYPDIAESTKRRVTRTAERMGYRASAQAQAIRTGRARSLGLVLDMSVGNAHKPFLSEFLDGVSRRASAENWTLTVATATAPGEEDASYLRLIDEKKVDGFILPRTRVRDPRISILRRADVPFVLYGRTGDPEGCAWFDIAGEEAMAQAVTTLAGLAHTRIGYLGGGQDFTYARLRREGFLRGMQAAGLEADPALMRSGVVSPETGARAALEILDHPCPPTAFVAALDQGALGLYRAADLLGLRVGGDLSVIAYDGVPESAYAQPPLSTFAVDQRAAGERLAELLLRRIRGAEPETLRELSAARFICRGSHSAPTMTSDDLARKIRGRNQNHPRGER